jgi:TonB family protein
MLLVSLKSLSVAVLLLCTCLNLTSTYAQHTGLNAATPETARGIELYRQGKFDEAIKALKKASKRDDAEVWHVLGLAYQQQGQSQDALKSFEKALPLRMERLLPNIPAKTIQAYSELTQEERTRRLAQVVADYRGAAETVAAYVSLQPAEADFWQAQLLSLRFYATHIASSLPGEVYSSGDVNTRAQVLQKPYPIYTERARRTQRSGTVVLRATLASDSTVQHILILKRLPDGLTENAIAAARTINFKPAMKDGRPVSTWTTLEYNFNID